MKSRQTPARIVFGRELNLPCDLEFGSARAPEEEVTDYVDNFREQLLQTHRYVKHM